MFFIHCLNFAAFSESDDPHVPFIYDDVSSLITSLMRLIFKADKVDEAAVRNLIEFDFTLNYNWHLLNSINIGCAAANWIVDLNPIQNGGAKAPLPVFPCDFYKRRS